MLFIVLKIRWSNKLNNEKDFYVVPGPKDQKLDTNSSLVTKTKVLIPKASNAAKNNSESVSQKSKNSFNYSTNSTLVSKTNTNLAIPGYKKYEYLKDFVTTGNLASGGFGKVYLGTLRHSDIINLNKGESSCVVKKAFNEDLDSFSQELSVHEVFKKSKYFSKLLCYSEKPTMIVFKYYKLGSLFSFLFLHEKNPSVYLKYNYELALRFAVTICTSLSLMHSKGYLHNDLKPGNILLDSDQEEDLFPVLCDFGAIEVLDSAKVTPGFKVIKSETATPDYSAPEVLLGYRKNKRICTVKTDIYSYGIVVLELFTRKRAWIKFEVDNVINGCLPDIKLTRFLDNLNGVGRETVVKIIKLIVECIDLEPGDRPTTESLLKLWESFGNRKTS
jgi:serine/threonine protein kinase